MNGYPRCRDCGLNFPPTEHACSVVMQDRHGAFVLCARCWLKRDPSERGEAVALAQAQAEASA